MTSKSLSNRRRALAATWTAVSEAESLFGSRKPHRTSSGGSTPQPFSMAGRAAPFRCEAARFLNGPRASLQQLASTWSCSTKPRLFRPSTRRALTHGHDPARTVQDPSVKTPETLTAEIDTATLLERSCTVRSRRERRIRRRASRPPDKPWWLRHRGRSLHSKPRLPLAFTPQLCPVVCCPTRGGREASITVCTMSWCVRLGRLVRDGTGHGSFEGTSSVSEESVWVFGIGTGSCSLKSHT